MPSPFPGMDPHLEGNLWTTLHFTLAAEIVRQLSPKLRPRYVALPVERFVLEITTGATTSALNIFPDVGIAETRGTAHRGTATLTMTPPLRMATIIPEQVPHVTIEIRDTQERRLVTAIEILSPTNKRGEGYMEYIKKRRQLLLSDTHLLEIDLLRRGTRVPMQKNYRLGNISFFSAALKNGQSHWFGRLHSNNRCQRCRFRCCQVTPMFCWICRQPLPPHMIYWVMIYWLTI